MVGFMDPIKIPQNVYIEDRIVGPLTLRQLLMTAVGGGLSYVLWSYVSKTYGPQPLMVTVVLWIPLLIAVAFAFVKVNDISLIRMLLLLLERSEKSNVRTFSPRRGLTINFRTWSGEHHEEAKTPSERKAMGPIDEISTLLDTALGKEPSDTPKEPSSIPTKDSAPAATPKAPVSGSVSIFRDIHPPLPS